MTDRPPTTREERLKAALRDNLKRRKAQARGRSDSSVGEAPGMPATEDPSPRRED